MPPYFAFPRPRHSVYCIFGAEKRPLYVGVSHDPLLRLQQHGKKTWWHEVESIVFEHFTERDDAEARELFLIGELRPEHNTRHKPKLPDPPDLPVANYGERTAA